MKREITIECKDDRTYMDIMKAVKKETPIKPKVQEWCRLEDGEPFINLLCGECEDILIDGWEWLDLSSGEQIKTIADTCIEPNSYNYCPRCGKRIDWEVKGEDNEQQ